MKYILALLSLFFAIPAVAQERMAPVSQSEIQLSFAPVVKNVSPAVVNIYTSRKVQVQSLSPVMGDPFFQQFFGGRGFGGMTRERVVSSLGSGVIVDPRGLVVTSHHVIEGATDIVIALSDRREFKAKLVTADPSSDLALLQIQQEKAASSDFPSLTLIDSDTAQVGDLVLAIGNPFGVGQTVTSGIVSALARPAEGITDYNFFIQTDAAINPGNSGGALVNSKGELIGINTAIYSRTGASNGIGFAIPSNMVMALTRGSASGGSVMRPWLGAEYQDVIGEIARSLGMDRPRGALVKEVYDGSPADEAGVKPGDVILSLEDIAIEDVQSLKYRVATAPLDKTLPLKILRGGREIETEVELTLPPENPARDKRLLKGAHPLDGVTVLNLSPRVAVELNLSIGGKGVVVASEGSGTGARLGFQKGDKLLSLNGLAVSDTRQLESLLQKEAYGWNIQFERGGQRLNLTVN